MSDPNPPSNSASDDLIDELRSLGDNLRSLLESAWSSEERKRLKQDLEAGLSDVKASLNQAATDFAKSPTGQTLKSDIEDFNERLRTGEVESVVRREILGALRTANEGLKKAADDLHPKPPAES